MSQQISCTVWIWFSVYFKKDKKSSLLLGAWRESVSKVDLKVPSDKVHISFSGILEIQGFGVCFLFPASDISRDIFMP